MMVYGNYGKMHLGIGKEGAKQQALPNHRI